jgi:hypothetical protein
MLYLQNRWVKYKLFRNQIKQIKVKLLVKKCLKENIKSLRH